MSPPTSPNNSNIHMQLERILVENGFEEKGEFENHTSKHCQQQQPYDVGSEGKRGETGVVMKLRLLFLGALKILTNLEEFVLLFGKGSFTPKMSAMIHLNMHIER
jgi:hypothetical protein